MDVDSEIQEKTVEKRVWGFWATAGWGALVMFISFAVQVVIAVIFIVTRLIAEIEPALTEFDFSEWMDIIDVGLLLSVSIVASSIICVLLIFFIIKVRRDVTIADYLGFRSISTRVVLAALAISVAYLILSVVVNAVLNRPAEPDFMAEAYASSVWPAIFWVSIVFLGPFFEEVLFRGFLFEGFSRSRLGVAGTIFLTALVWAGFHLQYGFFEIASIFVLGLILGVMRYKTGSIWAPMIMHAFNNLVAVLLLSLEIGV
jgi:membrane protease YdiL (CAAX protease family)